MNLVVFAKVFESTQRFFTMRVLLDTNVLIRFEEAFSKMEARDAEAKRRAASLGHVFFCHPEALNELRKDRNDTRRDVVLSRAAQYEKLEQVPAFSTGELKRLSWRESNSNDRVDNLQLLCVKRGTVDFFITDDNDIHKKAKSTGIGDRVLRPDRYLNILKDLTVVNDFTAIGLHESPMNVIPVEQEIFDSLRADYAGFDGWWTEKARSGRKAWHIGDKNSIEAICVYKNEVDPVLGGVVGTLDGRVLKICTFKVSEFRRGRKYGERLLAAAVKAAVHNKSESIYLTTFGTSKEMLVDLIKKFGFVFAGKSESGEDVYIKRLIRTQVLTDFGDNNYQPAKTYPHFVDGQEIGKHLIPIRPEFFNRLFDYASDWSDSLFQSETETYTTESGTILKAYLCHANTQQIQRGDLVFFYRSVDRKRVEAAGIVESTLRSSDPSEIIRAVANRTVYSAKEIEEMCKKEVLVILFVDVGSTRETSLAELQNAGIEGAIQSIRKISHDQYLRCLTPKRNPK